MRQGHRSQLVVLLQDEGLLTDDDDEAAAPAAKPVAGKASKRPRADSDSDGAPLKPGRTFRCATRPVHVNRRRTWHASPAHIRKAVPSPEIFFPMAPAMLQL